MITLAQVKSYLWITTTDDDVRLQAILDVVNDYVVDIAWDIDYWEKEQKVNKRAFLRTKRFTLNIINPEKLLEVNWVDYTNKVEGVDYFIDEYWDCYLKEYDFNRDNDAPFFIVKYKAWYSPLPDKLIWLVSDYVSYLFNQEWGQTITEERLWPRSVKFWGTAVWNNWELIDLPTKRFKGWIRLFIPTWLIIY